MEGCLSWDRLKPTGAVSVQPWSLSQALRARPEEPWSLSGADLGVRLPSRRHFEFPAPHTAEPWPEVRTMPQRSEGHRGALRDSNQD